MRAVKNVGATTYSNVDPAPESVVTATAGSSRTESSPVTTESVAALVALGSASTAATTSDGAEAFKAMAATTSNDDALDDFTATLRDWWNDVVASYGNSVTPAPPPVTPPAP